MAPPAIRRGEFTASPGPPYSLDRQGFLDQQGFLVTGKALLRECVPSQGTLQTNALKIRWRIGPELPKEIAHRPEALASRCHT